MAQPEQPTPNQQSIGTQLAVFLFERRDQILSDCMAAIERDEKVPTSDTLNRTQLRDDLPQILDNLALVLSDACNQDDQWAKDHDAWEIFRGKKEITGTHRQPELGIAAHLLSSFTRCPRYMWLYERLD
jgi:hypothetical protein